MLKKIIIFFATAFPMLIAIGLLILLILFDIIAERIKDRKRRNENEMYVGGGFWWT